MTSCDKNEPKVYITSYVLHIMYSTHCFVPPFSVGMVNIYSHNQRDATGSIHKRSEAFFLRGGDGLHNIDFAVYVPVR